ncbi:MAG: hypothetical protein K2X93_22850 [Candidatus Obscuribacterales bacterium]|nr:hypothetical protein [Candidatus Obscuribacterales bacterium]
MRPVALLMVALTVSGLSNAATASENSSLGARLLEQARTVNAMPVPVQENAPDACEKQCRSLLIEKLFDEYVSSSPDIQYVMQKIIPDAKNPKLKNYVAMIVRRSLYTHFYGENLYRGCGVGDFFPETYQVVEPFIAVATDARPYEKIPASGKNRLTKTEQIQFHNMLRSAGDKLVEDFSVYVDGVKIAHSVDLSRLRAQATESKKDLSEMCGSHAVGELDRSLKKFFANAESERMQLPFNQEELGLEARRERFRLQCLNLLWKSACARSPDINFVCDKLSVPISSVYSSESLKALLSGDGHYGSAYESTAVGADIPSSYRVVLDGTTRSAFALFKKLMKNQIATELKMSSSEQVRLFDMLIKVSADLSDSFAMYTKVAVPSEQNNSIPAEAIRDFTKSRNRLVNFAGEEAVEEVDQLIRDYRNELRASR